MRFEELPPIGELLAQAKHLFTLDLLEVRMGTIRLKSRSICGWCWTVQS